MNDVVLEDRAAEPKPVWPAIMVGLDSAVTLGLKHLGRPLPGL